MKRTHNIIEIFAGQVRKDPNKIALIDRDGSQCSFSELYEQVCQTAAWMQRKGIQKGDRVLVFVPMSQDLYRIVLALFYLGATAVFLDEWVSKSRLELCCKMAKCKAMIGVPKARFLALFSKVLRQVPIKLGTGYRRNAPKVEMADVARDDTALITFTTGSTGIPKAADRTHGFLAEQFKALKVEIQPKASEIAMPILPIVLLMNLGAGSTSVIADYPASRPEKMDPARILDQVQHHQVNRITASPYVIQRMAEHILQNGMHASSVQRIFTGGAPVFPDAARVFQAAFYGADIRIAYGSTEAEPISTVSARELVSEQGLKLEDGLWVGQRYIGAEVAVIPIQDQSLDLANEAALKSQFLAANKVGEIIVKGHHVLKHYIDNPQAEQRNKIFIGDTVWHRTGDAGFLDQDGQLYLTGRCKQMIPYKEGYLSPFLYEYHLQKMDGIQTGTLITHKGWLWVVVEMTVEGPMELASKSLMDADLPFNKIVYLDEIPRDPRHHSKIDYDRLNQILNELNYTTPFFPHKTTIS